MNLVVTPEAVKHLKDALERESGSTAIRWVSKRRDVLDMRMSSVLCCRRQMWIS